MMSSSNIKTFNDDSLYQIYEAPVFDGDLISKTNRDKFVEIGWVARCEGYNIITDAGRNVVVALGIKKLKTSIDQKEKDTECSICNYAKNYAKVNNETT